MKSAGAVAHRWGWSLNRTENPANIAQPSANPHSTAPLMRIAAAGMNGAKARSSAASRPVASEPATILPMCPLGRRSVTGGESMPLRCGLGAGVVGVVVTMGSIPCPADVARVQQSALGDVPSTRRQGVTDLGLNPHRDHVARAAGLVSAASRPSG
jgi:hypothetical protein